MSFAFRVVRGEDYLIEINYSRPIIAENVELLILGRRGLVDVCVTSDVGANGGA